MDHDPLSARAEYTAHQVIARDSWETRTTSSLSVSCSYNSFILEAELTAYEGEDEVFSRTWRIEILRDGL